MNTNTRLCCESQAADYILRIVDSLGSAAGSIQGVHLHTSFSGEYVEKERQRHNQPEYNLPAGEIMDYVLKVDRHQPFRTAAARRIVDAVHGIWCMSLCLKIMRTGKTSWYSSKRYCTGDYSLWI